jgi:N-acetylneuraminate synthase
VIHSIDFSNDIFVIAEAGVNHNGDPDLALELIDVAAEAGADAIKFQTFRADRLISQKAPKADYQIRMTGAAESQHEMVRKLELTPEMHRTLIARAAEKQIQFLSTPFDEESARWLVADLGLPLLKIPSGELNNPLLLLAAAGTNVPVILSTGMATLDEIADALDVLAFGYAFPNSPPSEKNFREAGNSAEGQAALTQNVALLHCTTEYPTPFDDVNLRAMDSIRDRFGLVTGYSDHTVGITVPVAAAARGAQIIEKHFTTDRSLPGPDHAASLEPSELVAMVRAIRETETSLGSETKAPAPSEQKNIAIARKSLVASRAIAKGEAFSADNLTVKRPGNGVPPVRYWDYLERSANRNYAVDELVD